MPTKTYPMLDDTGKRIASALEYMSANTSPIFDHVEDGAGPHNNFYRGKNLGGTVTAPQFAQISAGTFKDLFIGDYWTIGSVNYRIAAFDYYYNTGDTNCTTHHAVIVPDTILYSKAMNANGKTDGGYPGSEMFTTGLEDAKTTIKNAFGAAHILSHRKFIPNAVTNGAVTGAAWMPVDVDLMTEEQVYGTNILMSRSTPTVFQWTHTVDKTQLPLFRFRPDLICLRQTYWLQNVCSSTHFAYVSTNGLATCDPASGVYGVRPAFCLS